MTKKYKFFILGSYGQRNMGDEGLLEVFRDQLKDHKLVFNSHDPKMTQERFKVEAVTTYGLKGFFKRLKALLLCTAVIYGGGTIIIQENPKIRLMMFLGNLLAKIFRKKVIYLGVGVGFLKPALIWKLFRHTYNLVTLRDQESLIYLAKAGITKNVYPVTDPMLLMNIASKSRVKYIFDYEKIPRHKKLLIGLSPRFRLDKKEYEPIKQSFVQLADYLVEKYEAHVLFIPIQRSIDYKKSYDWKYDDQVVDEIKKEMRLHMEPKHKDKVFTLEKEWLPSETAGILGQLDLYVGLPLHASMLAFLQGVPVVGINYSLENDKLPSFYRSINQEKFLIANCREMSFEDLKKLVDESLKNLDGRRAIFEPKIQALKEKAKENFELLFEVLEH